MTSLEISIFIFSANISIIYAQFVPGNRELNFVLFMQCYVAVCNNYAICIKLQTALNCNAVCNTLQTAFRILKNAEKRK